MEFGCDQAVIECEFGTCQWGSLGGREIFNETPVVGAPMGFVATDWHLDVVSIKMRAGLGFAGVWQHSEGHSLPPVQSWLQFRSYLSLLACSLLGTSVILQLIGRAWQPSIHQGPEVSLTLVPHSDLGWASGFSSHPVWLSHAVQLRKQRQDGQKHVSAPLIPREEQYLGM